MHKAEPWQQSVRTTTRHLAVWTGLWLLSMAIATFGSILVWPDSLPLKVLATAINLLIGFGMIRANIRHIRSLDELMQKLHLEAMGLSLGLSVVLGLAYSVLEIAEVITFRAEISHLVIIMALSYFFALLIGIRRYR